jgi:hypothetical protein
LIALEKKMGVRVTIENTGDADTEEGSNTTARVEFYEPNDRCTAERLGQLIGYAANAMDSFIVPGDLIRGIEEVLNSSTFKVE